VNHKTKSVVDLCCDWHAQEYFCSAFNLRSSFYTVREHSFLLLFGSRLENHFSSSLRKSNHFPSHSQK